MQDVLSVLTELTKTKTAKDTKAPNSVGFKARTSDSLERQGADHLKRFLIVGALVWLRFVSQSVVLL